jgi:hypothetical protein
MRSMIVRWFGATLAVGALTFAGVVPSYAQVSTAATTEITGVPNTPFIFHAGNFRADELVSYWINTPDGKVISTDPLVEADKNGHTTTPMIAQANSDGDVAIFWTAPDNTIAGLYSLIIQGLDSNHQERVLFTMNWKGSQTVTQYDVTPTTGPTGTLFVFHATGFRVSSHVDGEQVAYWINTPNGKVISTEPLAETDKNGNTTSPMLAWADSDGNVAIFWSAPADAQLGSYSLVIHGLVGQHEVRIPFNIK